MQIRFPDYMQIALPKLGVHRTVLIFLLNRFYLRGGVFLQTASVCVEGGIVGFT